MNLEKRTLLLATAVIASLSLTACGKKKQVGTPVDKQKVETKNSNVEGQVEGELPAPNDESTSSGKTPTPTPTPKPLSDMPPEVNGENPPKVTTAKPVKEAELNPIPQDYDSADANNVTKDATTKRFTGGKTSDGLLYTGTSTDSLLAYLRARNEKVGWETRRLNYAAAASVKSAKLEVDSMSGEALFTLKLEEGGAEKVYKLSGEMTSGAPTPVKVVQVGTNGSQPMSGTLKCLDLDGKCENSLLRLKVGWEGATSIVNIIFRQSVSDAYFHLPGEYSNSSEYYDIREMAMNSLKRVDSDNRIKSITMNSFEVVNGRAGFDVMIKVRNNELLGFSGPLLAPEAGTAVKVSLTRVGQEANDTLDLLALNTWNLNYQNTIADATLINNNGLGQLRLAFKMRKRSTEGGEQFAVTVMRKVKPLVSINETSLGLK